MVVGTGKYKDTNEAYPLDKKMLRKVALVHVLREAFPDDPLRGDFALFGYGVNNG